MSTTAASVHDPKYQKAIYVFEAPVRLWHWIHALSIGVLCVTGYFIANPLPSLGGEASDHFASERDWSYLRARPARPEKLRAYQRRARVDPPSSGR